MRAETAEILTNVPLKESAKETSRALADFYDDLVTDPQRMAPEAAKYARQRKAWLTPEVMQRWGVGWSPSRSMFRKNYFIFTHRDEVGHVLSYSGRDLYYEEKRRKWEQAGRPHDAKPIKHKFVKGYHKGQELYGQHKQRLTPEMAEALAKFGLIVAEGMFDVIRLDCLGLAAVGLCSNRATDRQVAKIVRLAKMHAAGRIWLMPDNDAEGQQGFRELLWKLQQQAGIEARPAWSSEMHGGVFHEREPEDITDAEFEEILAPFLLRREAE